MLPPCQRTLEQKVNRANYVSLLWARAGSPKPAEGLDPLNFGWKERGSVLSPVWYIGPCVPEDVFAQPSEEEKDESDGVDLEDTDEEWSDENDSETSNVNI